MNPKEEPVSWNGAITALAIATIPLLRAFNVHVTEAQSDAILAFLAALVVVATIVLRSRVLPKQKVPPPLGTAPVPPPKEGESWG